MNLLGIDDEQVRNCINELMGPEADIYQRATEKFGADGAISIVKCNDYACLSDCPVRNNLLKGCPVCGRPIPRRGAGWFPALIKCECGLRLLRVCNDTTAPVAGATTYPLSDMGQLNRPIEGDVI